MNRYGRAGWPVEACAFAVTQEDGNTVRLLSVNRQAEALGLEVGMTLAAARASVPDLVTEPCDCERDQLFLRALQRWSERFSPWIATDGTDGLLINASGCAHLFGGEAAMIEEICLMLGDLGVEAYGGLAETKGAAKALARFGGETRIIEPGRGRDGLAAMPVEALGAGGSVMFELKRLGLHRIGDLYPLKSADLAKRFGFAFLAQFEQLLGISADPVLPAATQPVFSARITLPDPTGLLEDVSEAVRRLTEQICRRLHEHEFGVRALQLTAERADHATEVLEIGLARPTREAGLIMRQFDLKLPKLDAGSGIDRLRLVATVTEPFKPVQKCFAEAESPDGLEALVATLGNQLGFDRVLRWAPVSSHLPRKSFRFVEAVQWKALDAWPSGSAERPLLSIDHEPVAIEEPGRPPRKFTWRKKPYETVSAAGPERIGSAWWQGPDGEVLRDYWQVETGDGAKLWLATRPGEKPASWTVAGVFP